MLLYIQKIVADLLLPPGIFIVLLLVLSAYMFYSKQRGRYLVIVITVSLYLLSTGWAAGMLMRPLENMYAAQMENADVILVLGGGASLRSGPLNKAGEPGGYSANRLLTAAQLQHRLQVPILITGGKVVAGSGNEAQIGRIALLNLGIADDMIIVEDRARNTEENAALALALCRERGFKHICLVTSAFHMPRSMLNFSRANDAGQFILLPYPCDYQCNETAITDIFSFVPRQEAFTVSYLALHEYFGLAARKIL